ncbi:MAG: cation:proton antiporter, partial [Oscillospiraceae bacterium]|nr:cation:proton antiporter [Oscillospiraceae bacterium]
MLLSLAVIFLVGLTAAAICEKIRLPRIVGMLTAGIVMGPFALGALDDTVLGISSELRRIALIIILIRAGLTLDLADLKKVGRPAVMMSFVPACCEIAGYVMLAPVLFGVDRTEAALMGAVLSAVSPAVVVPRMVKLIEDERGTAKGIPQMILAGASCDDIFVIVLFSSFLTMAQGGEVQLMSLADIPVSMVTGVSIGAAAGIAVYQIVYAAGDMIKPEPKVIVLLGTAFMLMSLEDAVKPYVTVSGLLAVVAMACVVRIRSEDAKTMSARFGSIWTAAEIWLFVLVGAAVDIRYTFAAGGMAVLMILAALVFRTVGVLLCLAGTKLTVKERLFCVIAYLP